MKKLSFILVTCLLLISTVSKAQPGGDEDVVDVPIDGAIGLLIMAGVCYGANKLYNINQFADINE